MSDWQAKLRRLGVVKGTRHIKSPSTRPSSFPAAAPDEYLPQEELTEPQTLETLLPGGRLEETADGACFVLDKVYPLHHQHGNDRLASLLEMSLETAVPFCQEERFTDSDFRDFIFLDTETTGLAGAGTIAFMVGIGFFDDNAFVVRQYFLRDHGDEPAMFLLLDDLLAEKAGLVTFNGRTFDLPLLDRRYLMNRMANDLQKRPHLDLLPPARRLWRQRLGSVALSALEPQLLDVHRTQEDVPGWAIPGLYHDFLRSGDARPIKRVFYHNHVDMLSMVTLATHTIRHLDGCDDQHPVDRYSLGKWQADLGLTEAAEVTLRQAAAAELPLDTYHATLHRLALMLKRADRRDEAAPLWQQIAATSFDDVDAHVELAKHYEWQENDVETALRWTEEALSLVDRWSRRGRAQLVREELAHRRERLRGKLG